MVYDIVIVGGGVAGLAAGMYAGRFNMKTLVLGELLGGTITLTSHVENYPGFKSISGIDLAKRIEEHAREYNIEIVQKKATNVKKSGKHFIVQTNEKKYQAKTVLFAMGTRVRKLGVPGEKEFDGKGAHYCALCLHPDEELVVNGSIKKIKDVTPLTKVLTHDGTHKDVQGFMKSDYKGKLVKVRTRFFNEPVLLTPNHPVLRTKTIKHKNTHKGFTKNEWIEAGNLVGGDCVIYPIIKEVKDVKSIRISDHIEVKKTSNGKIMPFIPTHTSNEINDNITITEDFMRLVGYYIAEGSATKEVKFHFNKNETEYIEDVTSNLKRTFKLKPDAYFDKNICSISIYSKVLRDLFKHLFGNYAYNKHLPSWAMTLPLDKQKELIKGLWRGDGCMREKDFTYVTSSRGLAYQLRDLLLRQGIISSLQRRDKRGLNRKQNKIEGRIIGFNFDKYELTVGGQFLQKMSSLLGVKHPKIKHRKHSCKHAWIKDGTAILPVRNIEKIDYEGKVLNVGVEKNNTYVAKNFIVHNCDGPVYSGKTIGVVGGSDSAAIESLILAEYAKKVFIIYRKEKIRAEPVNYKRVMASKRIEIINNTNVLGIKGDKFVNRVVLDKPYKGKKELPLDAVFIGIGRIPLSGLAKGLDVKLNKKGEIIINKGGETNLPGVYAAGDITDAGFKQAIVGVAEAISGVFSAYNHIRTMELKK